LDFSILRFLGRPFTRETTDKNEVGVAIAFHIPKLWTVALPPEDWSLKLQ